VLFVSSMATQLYEVTVAFLPYRGIFQLNGCSVWSMLFLFPSVLHLFFVRFELKLL
jgi:hypothetical protein